LLAALERLMAGRTTFIIAHRLATIQRATRIVVLEDGRITESGSHAELLAMGGRYQHFYQQQYGSASAASVVGAAHSPRLTE
jgi:ABC-type multidrug transport system fused ATPase/permease subunit